MIIARAPTRISFIGGGTDLPDYYQVSPGKVISTAIDKYVYVVINPVPLLHGIYARYSINENVTNVRKLKNDRIREALLDLNIKDNLEIGVFSNLPTGIGLGGSSSFSVALYKVLLTYLGIPSDKEGIAKKACFLEMNLVKQTIGKQDQYAASYGGFNIFQFLPNEDVLIDPLFLDYKTRFDLENHLILFYIGLNHVSSEILQDQKSKTKSNFALYNKMVENVDAFKEYILAKDFLKAGTLLHENWLIKKQLSSKITNSTIDQFYDTGIKHGAWGGKILGAGGGGCILFFAPVNKKGSIGYAIKSLANKLKLPKFREIPFKFVESGGEIIYNSMFHR